MPPSLPFVSVIVPVYNGEAHLPELLSALKGQSYPGDRVEFILVDNQSRDRSLDLLKAAQAEATASPWQILQETTIQSSYAARNRGIRAAQGEILAFTDADCVPQRDWLEQLVKPWTTPQPESSVYPNATEHSTPGPLGLVAGEILGAPARSWLEDYATAVNTLSQTHVLAHPFCPYGQTANLAIRREALEKTGLFRPYLTTGGDADLCWRIQRETPWRLAFAPEAIVAHSHRTTLAELRSQWARYGRSNAYLHELHGIPLMDALPPLDWSRTLARWLLKEIPRDTLKALRRQQSWTRLAYTPLGLFCRNARFQGQTSAHLPPKADWIEHW